MAALDAKATKPAGSPAPVAESVGVVVPVGAVVAKENVAVDPAKPVSPSAAPEAKTAEDLSFVAEQYRKFVENAPPEFRAYLRKEMVEGGLRQADYTKKTQALAVERKSLEDRKVATELGEAVMSKKELLALVQAEADRLDGKTVAPTFDPFTATPEDWARHDAAIAEKAKADTLAAIKAEKSEESKQASSKSEREVAIFNAVKASIVDSGEATWDEVDAIGLRLQRRGVVFEPDTVVEALRDFLPRKAAKENPPVVVSAGNGSGGASALTRGTGVTPPFDPPKFKLEGRLPATRDERIAEALDEVNRGRVAKGLPRLTVS